MKINKILEMPLEWEKRGYLKNIARDKKDRYVNKAIELDSPSNIDLSLPFSEYLENNNQKNHILYKYNPNWKVGVGKPGKELFRDKNQNINDMQPFLMYNNNKLDLYFTFGDIFKLLLEVDSDETLKILGKIFFRMIWLLDHNSEYKIELGSDIKTYLSNYHFNIQDNLKKSYSLPYEVFIYCIEMIALNEDVKYFTKNKDIHSGTGRENNIKTYIGFIIKYLLRNSTTAKIDYISSLIQGRGVARINNKEIYKYLFSL